jgi:outer membrane protein TolC
MRSPIRLRQVIASGLCFCLAPTAWSQQQADGINPVRPQASLFKRPYMPVQVAPVRLANSSRLRDLIRAGKLYLSLQDAIALALENNIDIESQRYDSSGWRLERAEAGGALPGVPTGASQTTSVASGQGVLGSQAAAGVKISGASGGNGGGSNVTVQQVGTVAQTYDPSFQDGTTFSHRSLPQANAVSSGNSLLITNQRVYTASYQQGFETGGSVNISYNEHYLNENAPTDVLNPSVAPTLSISIQQNLLQGLGVAVNTQNIKVAKKNVAISDLNFRTQVERTVANVAGVYYSLVGYYQDLSAKQDALETARKFLEETKRRVELGASAQLDITTAQNQYSTAKQARVNSFAAIRQSELQLKGLISRTGTGDPLIAEAQIIPLDRIEIPESDELPAFKDMVTKAIAGRADLEAARANVETSEISTIATVNGLLPTGVVIASKSNAGLAGAQKIVRAGSGSYTADKYFAGGMGNALGQIFGNNFPSQSVGAYFQVQAFDRVAEADYAIDQLSLRQQQLGVAKTLNQVQVDIMNATVALRQARARHEAAIQNRILQQKLYEAEQKKFAAGESTAYNVTQQQRDFINGQAAELTALVNWKNARINLDQVTGATLETNHVSISEAQSGKVARPSALPAELPR